MQEGMTDKGFMKRKHSDVKFIGEKKKKNESGTLVFPR